MWQYDLCRDAAVLYTPSAGVAPHRAGGTALRVASGVVYGLWYREQRPHALRVCDRLRTTIQRAHGRVGGDVRERPPHGAHLLRLGPAGTDQPGGDPEGA